MGVWGCGGVGVWGCGGVGVWGCGGVGVWGVGCGVWGVVLGAAGIFAKSARAGSLAHCGCDLPRVEVAGSRILGFRLRGSGIWAGDRDYG